MEEKQEYRIVMCSMLKNEYITEFEKVINELLNDGWELLNGIEMNDVCLVRELVRIVPKEDSSIPKTGFL